MCALRLPGLYGLGDSLIVDPLLSGRLTHVPCGGEECLIDFCYVENAAHAHCVALDALLGSPSASRRVAGRAFNVTNGEAETAPVVPMWNQLLRICRPEARPLQPLPYLVAYLVACATEAIDWFTAGRVPCPRAAVWNLTRASLGFATTAVTLQLSNDLGYRHRPTRFWLALPLSLPRPPLSLSVCVCVNVGLYRPCCPRAGTRRFSQQSSHFTTSATSCY